MTFILRILLESFRQASSVLKSNPLRTFLSLLGITIGIFCIITVKSAVDSLEDSIMDSMNQLGSDVLYVSQMPWNEDPSQNYWKYEKRPDPSYRDYQAIKRKSPNTDKTSFIVFTGGRSVKFQSNSVSNAFIMGTTSEYADIHNFKIADGRFLTPSEAESGANKVILGNNVYKELFGNIDGVNRYVKLFGQDFQVIGYLEAEGESLINFMDFDDVIWVNYNTLKKFVNTGDNSSVGKMLVVKAKDGADIDELKGELTWIIRAERRLKPLEESNFALNEVSMLSQIMDQIFGVLNIAGFMIGIFALIVGLVSVANIMFVSVKERTNIIGIKKALGAGSTVILTEFLIESIILCIIGGVIGLLMVIITLKIISGVVPFSVSMSMENALIGVGASVFVGIISGIIPALQASKMDPVEAIRQ